MKQGTGKTRVAIELANSTDATLVCFIVPHALKDNIEVEISKWQLVKPFVIETYQGIAMSDRRYLELLERLTPEKVMIIADETIFIKNEQSKIFRRMLMLRDVSEYRLILNGTPITKNEWDIYNQMEFLSPLILKMTRSRFLKTFFKHIKFKKKGMKAREFYKFSEVNIEYLQKLIEPYTFYVDLEFHHLESEKNITIKGSVDEQYQVLKENVIKSIQLGEDSVIRQLRNIEYLVFNDEERLTEIAKQIKGQCIVFCNFRKEIETLHRLVGGYIIHGEIKQRSEVISKFKQDNQPLFIMLGIGAYGHNLQFCHRVVFSSLTFDYGKIEQAIYRVKRLGQTNDIEYTYFKSHYGIYAMIEENLSKKQSLHQIVIEKLGETANECL